MSTELQPVIGPDPAIVAVESIMLAHPQVDCPLIHQFTPGMYIRTIFMPAGTLVASKVHKTCHPFAVRRGKVSVYDGEVEVALYEAGFLGVTMPGTHRLLYNHEDTLWTTFHPNPTDERDLKKLEDMIIEFHEPPPLCPSQSPPLPLP